MTTLTELQNSPIYNLSMCSLENFHTCFLTWLGNKYPIETLKLFSDKKVTNPNSVNFEKQVPYGTGTILDLQVKITENNETEYLVIENKFKSYPKPEQLNKYHEIFKDKKTDFMLLSLDPSMNLPAPWHFISYSELANKMKGAFKDVTGYDKNLIEDYTNVIDILSSAFPNSDIEKYNMYEPTEYDKLGLRDIYIKYRTAGLSYYIDRFLNRNDLYIDWSFHNKKGTVDIVQELIKDVFNIGIQIEKNQYRYFARIKNISDDEKREELANELFKKGYWFFDTTSVDSGRIYKEFLGYNPDFIYRYISLDKMFDKNFKDISYEEIAKNVKRDMDKITNNLNEIKAIINKYI